MAGKGKTRVYVSEKVRAKLQQEIESFCPFCFNDEVAHFQVHHIDNNPVNNVLENLIMLCSICHSKITKKEIHDSDVLIKKAALKSKKILTPIPIADVDSVKRLLSTLDLELFQDQICVQESWYGYRKDAIGKMLDYMEQAELLHNRIINVTLKKLFDDFNSSLKEFSNLASLSVYGADNTWYKSVYENYPDKRRVVSDQLNMLAKNAFSNLEKIIVHLKKNNIDYK